MNIEPKKNTNYWDYRKVDENHRNIVKQAKQMYLSGKHAGSKPINRLKSKISNATRQIQRYTKAFTAMQELQKEVLKAKEQEENNIPEIQKDPDIQDAQIVEDNPTT